MTETLPGSTQIAVLGTGKMGASVAALFAAGGHRVRATASPRTPVEQIVPRVRAAAGDPPGGLPQVVAATDTAEACRGAEVVLECLPERLDVKQHELARAQAAAPEALLGTNTSSFRVSDVARRLPRPAKLAGTHYLYPPDECRLVEIVPGERTGPAVVERFTRLHQQLGFDIAPLLRDTPGFVINRLQLALLREACALVDGGVATAEVVDKVVSRGLGPRWTAAGPFATVALGGPDLFRTLAEHLYPSLSAETSPPGPVAKRQLDGEVLRAARVERDRRLATVLGGLP